MKFVFVTHCDSWLVERFGCNKMIASFKYFHPDIEMVHLNENDIQDLLDKNPGFCRYSMMPLTMLEVKRKTGADFVVHLDADSLCLGRFDEILEGNYDIAVVRNNNDDFTQDESMNRPGALKNIPNHLYFNCGCISTNSEGFLYEWYNLNKYIIQQYGKINAIKGVEQDTYNLIVHTGDFKTKILDPYKSNIHYGASANMHAPNHEIPKSIKEGWNTGDNWKLNSWGSWKDIEYKDNQFWLYGRLVKLIHQSGGGSQNTIKLSWDLFNDNTARELKRITGIE